jgi:hypothetical protein
LLLRDFFRVTEAALSLSMGALRGEGSSVENTRVAEFANHACAAL